MKKQSFIYHLHKALFYNTCYQIVDMNLLPKNYSQFKEKQYWNSFFKSLHNKDSFQWYGSFQNYRQNIFIIINQLSLLNNKSKSFTIAHLGCGNSTLAQDIVKGYPIFDIRIDNYDYSDQVIVQIKKNNKNERLRYEVCDLFHPIKEEQSDIYDIVLDKGTLDAVLPEDKSQNIKEIQQKYFENVKKMLKRKGNCSYIIISMLQSFILRTILQSFGQAFHIRIYQRMIPNSQIQPFLLDIRLMLQGDIKKQRVVQIVNLNKITMKFHDDKSVINEITKIQQLNRFAKSIKQLRAGQISKFSIFLPNTQIMRYSLQIIDHSDPNILQKNSCSVFIVPQGMQNLCMFNTEHGLQQFKTQINTSRLIVVKLIIGQHYKDIELIKNDLNNILHDVIQKGCNIKEVPYLTDGSIGQRHYIFQDEEIFIDEIIIQDEAFRRLILKNNMNLVQSQFKLEYYISKGEPQLKGLASKVLVNKKDYLVRIDNDHLDQGYCRIIASLVNKFVNKQQKQVRFLHLGGGGCSIPKYFHHQMQNSDHIIVQVSKSVVNNGGKFFQWPQTRFKVLNEDSLSFVDKQKGALFECIIMDISNEIKLTQFYPPQQFLSKEYIKKLKCLLAPSGILIINTIPSESNKHQKHIYQDFPFPYALKSLHLLDNQVYLFINNHTEEQQELEQEKEVLRIKDCLKIQYKKWQQEKQEFFAMIKPYQNMTEVEKQEKKKKKKKKK